jgi:heme/copper-type cytochrome/quinol oxidase subunit 2
VRKRVLGVLALLGLALFLVACSGGDKPQNTFDPAGPVAQEQKDLFLPVFWVAVAVFVVVEGGIVLIAIKYRHRKGRDRMPPQIHGATRLEIGWTIVPAVVLAFVMVPTVSLIWKLAERSPDAMQVTVQGYQWWWGFEYTDERADHDGGHAGRARGPHRRPVDSLCRRPGERRRSGWTAQPGPPGDPLLLGSAALREAGRGPRQDEPHRLLG